MTLTPDAEARIDDRIRRLSRRPGEAAARQELRAHVADAAESTAGGSPATARHVEAAFAGLGDDAAIRAAFFPRKARPPVGWAALSLAVLATAVAAGAILLDDNGGDATCSVTGPGTCSADSSGEGLDVLLWAAPPLLVLAAMAFLPWWTAVAAALAYLLVCVARAVELAIDGEAGLPEALLLVAAGLALAVAIRHGRASRGTAGAADA